MSGWDDFWGNLFKPINFGPVDEQKRQQVQNTGYGFSDRDQMGDLQKRNLAPGDPARQSIDPPRSIGADPTANISRILGLDQTDPYPSNGYTTDGNPGRQGNDDTLSAPVDEDAVRADKIRSLMAELEANGAGAENLAMVDQAFAGSLNAIQKARESAQSNYQASDKAIQGLTAGHVNEIKTKDRQAVEANANELSGAYTNSYNDAKNTLQADQNKALSARAEMLSRLGIQEAGLGNTGDAQGDAIQRLTEDNAARQAQASTYKAADLTRNTELASSQAAAGVERQGDLRKQLNGINANLDQSQASVENSKAQATISAKNADRADFLKQLQFYSDELKSIDESKAKKEQTAYDRAIDQRDFNAKNSGTVGGVFDVANAKLRNTGYDPTPYQQAYADVTSENGFDSRSGQDKVAYMQSKMLKKAKEQGINLTPSVALDYIMAIENFGTDKSNTKIAG